MHESIVFLVRVRCRRKRKFTFAISSPDEFLVRLRAITSTCTCSDIVRHLVFIGAYLKFYDDDDNDDDDDDASPMRRHCV